jgi:hypothetical protein
VKKKKRRKKMMSDGTPSPLPEFATDPYSCAAWALYAERFAEDYWQHIKPLMKDLNAWRETRGNRRVFELFFYCELLIPPNAPPRVKKCDAKRANVEVGFALWKMFRAGAHGFLALVMDILNPRLDAETSGFFKDTEILAQVYSQSDSVMKAWALIYRTHIS